MSYEALFWKSNYNIIKKFDLSLDRIMTFFGILNFEIWIFVPVNRKEASFVTKIWSDIWLGSHLFDFKTHPSFS